jgi:DNA-binding response OmpR family regulator
MKASCLPCLYKRFRLTCFEDLKTRTVTLEDWKSTYYMKQKILVIEDSRAQSKLLESLLETEGCSVGIAMSGAEARVKFHEERFDMILLDMILPDASGLQLLNEIKASEKNGATSVIILSGVTDKGNIVDALSNGAKDYITKPFHQTEFLMRIKLHLDYQNRVQELSEALAACMAKQQ